MKKNDKIEDTLLPSAGVAVKSTAALLKEVEEELNREDPDVKVAAKIIQQLIKEQEDES